MPPSPLLRRVFQFSCPDDRGRERIIPYPSMTRLARERIPRPFRTTLGIMSWRFIAILALTTTIPIWGALASSYLLRHIILPPLPRAGPGVTAPPPQVYIWPLMAMQAGTLILMVGGMAVVMIISQPGIAARYKRHMLRLPRCPWCLYDLAGTPVESGSRTCPECGGGWTA